MRKFLALVALAVGTAVLAASLVIAIEVIRDDRADRLAKQNRKLRHQVENLIDSVQAGNARVRQLEHVLREAGIPVPSEGGGDGRTTEPSRQPGAAPQETPAAPQPQSNSKTSPRRRSSRVHHQSRRSA